MEAGSGKPVREGKERAAERPQESASFRYLKNTFLLSESLVAVRHGEPL